MKRLTFTSFQAGTGIDASWKEEYHRNRDVLLTSSEQRQIADLRNQLSLCEISSGNFLSISAKQVQIVVA